MYNLRARYYSPVTGRFNQRDSFGGDNYDSQSLHKYSYANCDPGNGTDPTGYNTQVEQLVAIAIMAIGVSMNLMSMAHHISSGNTKAVPWDLLGIALALAGGLGGGGGMTLAPASGGALMPFAANFSRGARVLCLAGSMLIGGAGLMMQTSRLAPNDSSPPPNSGPYPNQMADKLESELAWIDRKGIVPAQPGTPQFWQILRENPAVKWAVTKSGKFGIVPYRIRISATRMQEIPHTAITRGEDAWAGEARLVGDTLELNKRSGHYTPENYSPGEVAFENTGLKVKYVRESLDPQ
jgi:hypothetical protein